MYIKTVCSWCNNPHDKKDVLPVQKGTWICRDCANKIKEYASFSGVDLHKFERKE